MAGFEITEGAVLGDRRYRLQRRLGAGGMASVWLARDERLERSVAVKLISDALAADDRYRERFAREARAAASVSHPNIVPVYDYGRQGDRPFLVMEYVPGETLARLIGAGRRGAVDPVAVAGQLLSALQCIHESGLVHRDVKPANILVDDSGRVRLTDFGIAQLQDAASLTQTGMVVGTLRYLAPEVAAGARPGPAADLYAAGVVLRELTEMEPAPTLTALIAALTAADPAARPASAMAANGLAANGLAAEADTTVTRVLTSGRTTGPTRPLPDRATGHGATRWRVGASAVVAVVLVVVVALALTGGGGSPPARSSSAGPAPAPAGASLSSQLRALNRMVDASAQR